MPNEKHPTNPWMIIGWIILAMFLLLVGSCVVFLGAVGNSIDSPATDGNNSRQEQVQEPAVEEARIPGKLQSIGFSCSDVVGRRTLAELSFKNVGATTIEFPKVLVRFGESATKDGILSPYTLRPGSTGSVTLYSPDGFLGECRVVSIKDQEGHPVEVYGLD